VWTQKGLLVNTFGAPEVFLLDWKGVRTQITTTPEPGLDGLAVVGNELYVSSWAGKAIYRGQLGKSFVPVITGMNASADFAYDRKHHVIVVPKFLDNRVEAYSAGLPATPGRND
jgi:hypothetical protein